MVMPDCRGGGSIVGNVGRYHKQGLKECDDFSSTYSYVKFYL